MRATCTGWRSCCAHKDHACMTELLSHLDENMETGTAGRLLSARNSRESIRAANNECGWQARDDAAALGWRQQQRAAVNLA